jgi:hypothetical protein
MIQVLWALTVLVLVPVLFGMILALPVMLLWDALMPTVFGLGTITWLQAWGLLVLCGLLFRNTSRNTSSSSNKS